MTCIVFFIFLDLPWPKEAPWRLLEGSQCCKSHVVEAVQHYHSLDHLGGDSESADEDDGDHRLVVLLLDGDDGPGVGEDGEKADWQGEDEEGGIKHLQVKNKSCVKKFFSFEYVHIQHLIHQSWLLKENYWKIFTHNNRSIFLWHPENIQCGTIFFHLIFKSEQNAFSLICWPGFKP